MGNSFPGRARERGVQEEVPPQKTVRVTYDEILAASTEVFKLIWNVSEDEASNAAKLSALLRKLSSDSMRRRVLERADISSDQQLPLQLAVSLKRVRCVAAIMEFVKFDSFQIEKAIEVLGKPQDQQGMDCLRILMDEWDLNDSDLYNAALIRFSKTKDESFSKAAVEKTINKDFEEKAVDKNFEGEENNVFELVEKAATRIEEATKNEDRNLKRFLQTQQRNVLTALPGKFYKRVWQSPFYWDLTVLAFTADYPKVLSILVETIPVSQDDIYTALKYVVAKRSDCMNDSIRVLLNEWKMKDSDMHEVVFKRFPGLAEEAFPQAVDRLVLRDDHVALKHFLQAGADVDESRQTHGNDTPLKRAACKAAVKCVETLLKFGANPYCPGTYMVDALSGSLLRSGKSYWEIAHLISKKMLTKIPKDDERWINLNSIRADTEQNRLKMLQTVGRYLLDDDKNTSAYQYSVNCCNAGGGKRLHYWCAPEPYFSGTSAQVMLLGIRLLVRAGANPNEQIPGKGLTPLHLACDCGTLQDIVSELLAQGADPEIRDSDGKNAMDHAENSGNSSYRVATIGVLKAYERPKKKKILATAENRNSPATPPYDDSMDSVLQ